ncbi:hypothetical protein [Paenochrobactrum glaciei]|uniref:Uncharacterized protein n=2 Tax=Paenochrobactrum glaciei TaxID=486407 RepID=A0ABN1GBS9_9HYPH
MRVDLSNRDITKLSERFYDGSSKPITIVKPKDKPLEIAWWQSHPKKEGVNSARHHAAIKMYLEIALSAKSGRLLDSFPAQFECSDRVYLRPDKGVIKSFLDKRLVTSRLIGSQLFFDLTETGKAYALISAESYLKR